MHTGGPKLKSTDSDITAAIAILRDLEASALIEATALHLQSLERPDDASLALKAASAMDRAKFLVELKILVLQQRAMERQTTGAHSSGTDPEAASASA